jgi:hypothetical protein
MPPLVPSQQNSITSRQCSSLKSPKTASAANPHLKGFPNHHRTNTKLRSPPYNVLYMTSNTSNNRQLYNHIPRYFWTYPRIHRYSYNLLLIVAKPQWYPSDSHNSARKTRYNICIVTACCVCADKYTGPKTAYQQQRRQLSAMFRQVDKVVDPDPNRKFILDLQSWISHIQVDGTHNDELTPASGQVVQLSFNPTILTTNTQHNGTLDTLIHSTGLVDVLGHHHPSPHYPATYNRGWKRIDLILVSASLLPAVKRSGILLYHSLFQGDHRPCYIDIDASIAFERKTPYICPPCQRVLQLKDPRIVTAYVETLNKQLDLHKVSRKVEQLSKITSEQWTLQNQTQYERLD